MYPDKDSGALGVWKRSWEMTSRDRTLVRLGYQTGLWQGNCQAICVAMCSLPYGARGADRDVIDHVIELLRDRGDLLKSRIGRVQ